ncbi:MAG: DUF427 domain-containing protein [Acidiferrobacterales bacterium]
MKAIWKDTVIAESDDTVVVEGNHYFPESAVKMNYLSSSETKSTCPWKGIASYYTISINGELNVDAAWYYPEPKEAASNIQGHIAFWRGVEITG